MLKVTLWSAIAVVLVASPSPAASVPRVELGLFIPFLKDLDNATEGVGGRVTWNAWSRIGLDLEVSNFTNVRQRNLTLAQMGVKLTWARSRFKALFVKLRPGIARFTDFERGTKISTSSHLAVDYGAGMELYPSSWFGVRFDGADLYIPDRGHNFFLTFGVLFRLGGRP